MTISRLILCTAAIAIAVGFWGCGTKTRNPDSPDLMETLWVHVPEPSDPFPHPEKHAATLKITAREDGSLMISGIGGCNRYHGSVRIEGRNFSAGPIASTKMRCYAPEGIMEYEIRFYQKLKTAAAWQITEKRLILLDNEEKGVLEFEAAKK